MYIYRRNRQKFREDAASENLILASSPPDGNSRTAETVSTKLARGQNHGSARAEQGPERNGTERDATVHSMDGGPGDLI